ncbi:MAG: hypothetical protein KGV50_05155 [Gammaproteobacteria bacterium]|nr:hypothetical protein [Gammaproteobacteria bacterium]
MEKRRTIADNLVRMIFSIVPFAMSYMFFYFIFKSFTDPSWNFNPLKNVIVLSFALTALFFGVFLIHSFTARVLFFIFLGIIGFLGLVSVIFFWHDVGGEQLTSFERTPENREYCFYIFTFCLGFGMLLFHWGIGKFFIVNCLVLFSLLYAVTGFMDGEYGKVVVSLFALFVAKIARKNLTAVLYNVPSIMFLDYTIRDLLSLSVGGGYRFVYANNKYVICFFTIFLFYYLG